jgi:hypothetical protein
VAHTLVAAGDVEHCLVVAVDEVGPAARDVLSALGAPALASGAVATLVTSSSTGAFARIGTPRISRKSRAAVASPGACGPAVGHRALATLVGKEPPRLLSTACPSGVVAEIDLFPV